MRSLVLNPQVLPGKKEGEIEREEREREGGREADITESQDTFHPYLLCLCVHNVAVKANAEAR